MKPEDGRLIRARCDEVGLALTDEQVARLLSYGRWLIDEALPAGALGPGEAARVLERHVLDSVAFVLGWDSPPPELIDIGSGAGLPGIPLAVVWPGTRIVLLERSGRRARLLRRALRVLGLSDVDVEQGDAVDAAPGWPAAVMRGVLPPDRAVTTLDRLLAAHGRGAVAVGAGVGPPPSPASRTLQIVENHSTVLARTVRLLIMAPL